jgi:virginiamycin B lyase
VITLGADGDLWYTNRVADFYTGNEGYIGRITTSGQPTVVTRVADPEGITAGPRGSIWFANYANSTTGRITQGGRITEFARPGISEPQNIGPGPARSGG